MKTAVKITLCILIAFAAGLVQAQNRLPIVTQAEHELELLRQVTAVGAGVEGQFVVGGRVELQEPYSGPPSMILMMRKAMTLHPEFEVTEPDQGLLTFYVSFWNRYYRNAFIGAVKVALTFNEETGEWTLPPLEISMGREEKFQIFSEKKVKEAHLEFANGSPNFPIEINEHGILYSEDQVGADAKLSITYEDGTVNVWRVGTGNRIDPGQYRPEINLRIPDWLFLSNPSTIEGMIDPPSIEKLKVEVEVTGASREVPVRVMTGDANRPVRNFKVRSFLPDGREIPFGPWKQIGENVTLDVGIHQIIFK